MNAKEAINEPVTIMLGNRQYKVREIGILKILAIIEAWIEGKQRNKIVNDAQLLKGSERSKYIEKQVTNIPEGIALERRATEMMEKGEVSLECSIAILQEAMRTDQPELTLDDVARLYTHCKNDQILQALMVAQGSKKDYAPAEK